MKINILYDNESRNAELKADWGFSCLVEAHGLRLLFDTGTSGAILMENMRALGVEPGSIQEVFLSHVHFDHIGGLSSFLGENDNVRVFAPDALRGIAPAREVVYVNRQPGQLRPGLYTTGMLDDIEQSLVIQSERGLVVVAGCSHPGVGNILKAAGQFGTPYALIGGLHGFDEFDALEELDLICPTHCTQHIAEIRSLFPDKYARGGVGEIIEL